jgi:hypothetical protein
VDGFFVAKFKVMKKTKKTEAAAAQAVEDDGMDLTLNGDDDEIADAANATFNDEEDQALIKGKSRPGQSDSQYRTITDRVCYTCRGQTESFER